MVENHNDTHGKWIVHLDNINRPKNSFYHLKSFFLFDKGEATISELKCLKKCNPKEVGGTSIYPHDIIRNLTLEEYLILASELRRLGKKYNKKKDILI